MTSQTTVAPFLMFEGKAEEAMNFYVSAIPDSRVIDIRRYGADGPGTEGSVMLATFSLAGLTVMCIDSSPGTSEQVSVERVAGKIGMIIRRATMVVAWTTMPRSATP